jgi:dTDP-4-amino-4,6-dideoxy-D-galactose acyltransferase
VGMNQMIQHLQWDSVFFENKIGKIDFNKNTNLNELLNTAKNTGYQLIYGFCNENLFVEENILNHFNGKLVDRKVLFEKIAEKTKEQTVAVSEYNDDLITPELETLAYESGRYSRFYLDDNFSKEEFYKMYKIWIENSIKRQIADHVFVVEENNQIIGMVTLKIGEEKGEIGLMAISPDAQGKGYGRALLSVCEKQLKTNNILKLEVPTQLNNKNACMFYEKCGFSIKSITNIYHFWL